MKKAKTGYPAVPRWCAAAALGVACAGATGCDAGRATLDQGPPPDARPADRAPRAPDAQPAACTLELLAISGRRPAELAAVDASLDRDAAAAGIQLEVDVEARGKPDGTQVTLEVSGVTPAPSAAWVAGRARFAGVTVDPAATPLLRIQARAAGCAAAALSLEVLAAPTCRFAQPPDGARLFSRDDAVPGNASFELDVRVTTAGLADGTVQLSVDGQLAATAVRPDARGVAAFRAVPLPSTPSLQRVLLATLREGGVSTACQAAITVDTSAPAPAPR